jgi:hypothetical protein
MHATSRCLPTKAGRNYVQADSSDAMKGLAAIEFRLEYCRLHVYSFAGELVANAQPKEACYC